MKLKSETADTLQALIHKVGIPHTKHSYDAKEITEGKFKQLCSDNSILCTLAEPKRHIGRWLGQAYNVGQAMCYWILPLSRIPIARSTVTPYRMRTKH